MKEKIIAAIKAKFPAINLSKKRLNLIAAIIEKKVIDDEAKIDAQLDEFNFFNPIAELAKQDDTIRNLEGKLKPEQPPKDKDDKTEKDDKTKAPDLPDDTPGYVKTMLESFTKGFEKLSTAVDSLQKEKAQTSILEKVKTGKLKDVPVEFWGDRKLPEKEEEIEAFETKVETDYTQFTNKLTEKGLSVLPSAKSGTAPDPKGNGKTATKEELDTVMKDIM